MQKLLLSKSNKKHSHEKLKILSPESLTLVMSAPRTEFHLVTSDSGGIYLLLQTSHAIITHFKYYSCVPATLICNEHDYPFLKF